MARETFAEKASQINLCYASEDLFEFCVPVGH